jgi:hypothetical protein
MTSRRQRGVRFQMTPRLRRVKPGVRLADAAGAEGEPAPIWGGVFARFKDIDGNSFSLVSFDEVTHALEAQRRAIAEKLETERRAAQELEIAKRMQARLFPQTLPALRTLDYAGACMQAREVGGDYYDFLHLGQERLGMVIGDVSGKGIASALMANLQANLRSQCAIALDQPERFLRSVNQLFHENTDAGAFATLIFAEYDERPRRLRYVNCGHLAGLLLRGATGASSALSRHRQCWELSRNGIARWKSGSFVRATCLRSTRTGSRSRSTRTGRNSGGARHRSAATPWRARFAGLAGVHCRRSAAIQPAGAAG